MDNYDVKKEGVGYSARRGRVEVVEVPVMRFLMADGHGDPNTSERYREVVSALYATSYAVRAVAKAELGRVHTVGPLEGLWSAADLGVFHTRDKDAWQWTLMIVQPEWVTPEVVAVAKERKPQETDVRFEEFHEGTCIQTLHIGPYDAEGPTIARMHDEFMPAENLTPRGRHHEIYLSDARRTDPAKLRTILRQPVRSIS
ncbi:hypothetical protein LV79_003122 [Actinokineospora globicatena]|nr:GyrI-like domain-containing protein [Actinokineospora globicatena]MCP2303417.1 hypothetical protein [Actinokineospora globicatena]GLW79449.1 hypothetical protein Aglo01_39310 [Actinokineospora globicatena]GLW86141.1 hypothetical protein Aglo02_37800 [Actinokineospora globicatena]